jgi:hypothetical protein
MFYHVDSDGFSVCRREQTFKTSLVDGDRSFIGNEFDCVIERQLSAGLIVRIFRKLTGHIACGADAKFFVQRVDF